MKLLAVAACLSAACVLAAPPALPADYVCGEFEQLALNQGGINTDSGACCEPTAAQCKVQVIAEGSDSYVEYHHNRTRSDSPQGIIAELYPGAPGYDKKHGMQLQLQPGDDGGFVCAQYCPTDTDELSNGLAIKPTALDFGKHKITQGGEGGETKTVTEWYWTDRIVIIPLDHEKFYVDDSATPVKPFYKSEQICPFGHPIAVSNTSYLQFIPGFSPTRIFNISGVDGCQKSDNCGDNPNMLGYGRRNRMWNKFTPTVMQTAQKMVAKLGKEAKQVTAGGTKPFENITFVSDFVATEKSLLLINQGGQEDANGDFCCNHSKLGQCQIQLQSLDGQHYVDVTNQRTRFEDVHNGISVNDYNAHKSYEVVHNDTLGVDMCVKFCPLDPDETLDNQFLDDNAKDKGASTMNGKTVEKYEWHEVILKIIRMSTTDFYADQTNASAAVPVFSTQRLTPFGGAQIGDENHTWTDVKPGAIDPQKFNISGLDDCPQDPQCSQPSWQSKRVFFRQWATWASHMKLL